MRINEGKVHRITSVKSAGDRVVRLRFDNGKTYTVDLRVLVRHSRGLKALRGASLFARVALGEGGHSIAWPGDLDLGADTLWELALEQNGRTDAVEFIRWRWRNGLSLTNAAEALGLSRRQVAYYASGEHEVPRTVLLACKAGKPSHARPHRPDRIEIRTGLCIKLFVGRSNGGASAADAADRAYQRGKSRAEEIRRPPLQHDISTLERTRLVYVGQTTLVGSKYKCRVSPT